MARRTIFTTIAVALIAAGLAALAVVPAAVAKPAFKLIVTCPASATIGDTAAVRVVVRRTSGTPIRNVRVRFSWNVAGAASLTIVKTDRRGVAVSRRLMTCGGAVAVHVRATWQGRSRAAVPIPAWEVPGST